MTVLWWWLLSAKGEGSKLCSPLIVCRNNTILPVSFPLTRKLALRAMGAYTTQFQLHAAIGVLFQLYEISSLQLFI